jgi:mRNA-capping enzyme
MQRTRPWPKLNEHLAEFAAARPSSDAVPSSSTAPCGIYKPEYIQSLFDEYLERRFRTTAAPPLPAWKLESPAGRRWKGGNRRAAGAGLGGARG